MERLLKKLKLVDEFEIELNIQKADFISRLEDKVKPSDLGLFSDSFGAFSSSKKEYIGSVIQSGFKIKKRKKFFDMNLPFAVAKGKWTEREMSLSIKTKIDGFPRMFILFYVFLIMFYGMFLIGVLLSGEADGGASKFIFIPFLLIHGTFMMGIPYLLMRRSLGKLKYDLEREFYFLTKD
ncbi:MAG: hypothetical protein HOI49_10615 [Bacteroidetes bacterium]|jgi:hypothetical protein|nr:hypothetical protein [Bacteroidota bacterium]